MGKITRAESNLHDEACALIAKVDRDEDDLEFIFQNWNPMAEHNVGKGGIYFTPAEIAHEFAVHAGFGRVIDLCGGIGVLTWAVHRLHPEDWNKYVVVEREEKFVNIGRQLLPWAVWYHGDVLDRKLMTKIVDAHGWFDVAISNPPYGNVPQDSNDWLLAKGPIQWQVMEVALRVCRQAGTFIVPDVNVDFDLKKYEWREPAPSSKYLGKHYPGIKLTPIDTLLDESGWKGAAPEVRIADLDIDELNYAPPFGFGTKQPELFS